MPFAWVVIVIVWAVVSVINKSGQQRRTRQGGAQPARTAPRQAQAFPERKSDSPLWDEEDEEDREEGWSGRPAPAFQAEAKPVPPAPVHTAVPFQAHIHTPVMSMEGEGTEGEDCCHEFMLEERPAHPAAEFAVLNEQEQAGRARALLQGVIYSEVLGRRPVKRYGGRKA